MPEASSEPIKAYASEMCERIKRKKNICLTEAVKDAEAEKSYA